MATMPSPVLKTEHGRTYEAAEWKGQNTSGLDPIGDMVLVLPDKHVEKIGSIIVTDTSKDRSSSASQSGVLVAMGQGAFFWSGDRVREFIGNKPKPGDRVIFNRYAGHPYTGDDGETYRLMNDSNIAAIHRATKGE